MATVYKHQEPGIPLNPGYYWVLERTFGWMILYWKPGVNRPLSGVTDEWRYSPDGPEANEYYQITAVDPAEVKRSSNPPLSEHALKVTK